MFFGPAEPFVLLLVRQGSVRRNMTPLNTTAPVWVMLGSHFQPTSASLSRAATLQHIISRKPARSCDTIGQFTTHRWKKPHRERRGLEANHRFPGFTSKSVDGWPNLLESQW